MVERNPTEIAEGVYLDGEAVTALTNRLSRMEGHVRAIRRMVEDHRCADDILLQVAAVKASLNAFAAVLLEHELSACVSSCMPGEQEERMARVSHALAALLKRS